MPWAGESVPFRDKKGYRTSPAKQSADLLAQDYHEHPELASQGQQGGFLPRFYASQVSVGERVAPIMEEFESRLMAQQSIVSRWR